VSRRPTGYLDAFPRDCMSHMKRCVKLIVSSSITPALV
jgi:hypothetical protein